MKKGLFSFEIAPQFVDFQLRIKLSSLIDLILTASGYNADANGFGLRQLYELGGTWVLSRLAVEMVYFPKQYEKITIETWVEEVHTANTIRNFSIKNEKGEVIGKAISVWVMINLKTRRPMEMKLLEGIENYIVAENSGIDKPVKLDAVDSEPVDDFFVKYSDIDINQHVNTVHYLDWMVNCFTLDEHKTHSIKRLDVNFMNEILYNDHIQLFKEETVPKDYRFDIRANNKTACRGRIVF